MSGVDPTLVFVDDPTDVLFGTVAVTGVPDDRLAELRDAGLEASQWSTILRIVTGGRPGDEEDPPPVVGTYAIEDGVIRFRPRFPLAPGMTYYARFAGGVFDAHRNHTGAGTPDAELLFAMPLPDRPPAPRVEAIYPSAEVLPANLLRIYVHFSTPMRARGVHHHVHLYDEAGYDVSLPFVEIEGGLWDPAGRRLTLLFHPGRVKRGVGPNIALGAPLREGQRYRLVIDAGLRDASGYPLASAFEKEFLVGEADRRSPDLGDWRLAPPASSTGAVMVDFPEPLDHALLHRWIIVEDSDGRPIDGQVNVTQNETRWSFTPDSPWPAGACSIFVHPALEDLAGNTFHYLFDQDATERPGRQGNDSEALAIPFEAP